MSAAEQTKTNPEASNDERKVSLEFDFDQGTLTQTAKNTKAVFSELTGISEEQQKLIVGARDTILTEAADSAKDKVVETYKADPKRTDTFKVVVPGLAGGDTVTMGYAFNQKIRNPQTGEESTVAIQPKAPSYKASGKAMGPTYRRKLKDAINAEVE